MKLQSINSINFTRALAASEEKGYLDTAREAKKALGADGTTIFKFHTPSLPPYENDTGTGKLLSPEAMRFLKTMNLYTDSDVDKMMPDGLIDRHYYRGYFGPYSRGALTLGLDGINLNSLLKSPYYGFILSEDDIKELSSKTTPSDWADFENELGRDTNYPILKPLKKAYQNTINPSSRAREELKEEFEEYKKKPINQAYERLAVVHLIKEGKLRQDFFRNFEKSPDKMRHFEQLKKEKAKEIDFFKFCQFIAHKERHDAKEELNKQGKKLWGDLQIGFNEAEVLAFPDAFKDGASSGWGLPVLNYDEIFNPDSEAHKLFDAKIRHSLETYDGIRFDVGWSYIVPKMIYSENHIERRDFKDKLLNYIDKIALEVKGRDFDLHNLVYEADAGYDDFTFVDKNKKAKPYLKNHTLVLTTQYQNTVGWGGLGWGNHEFLKKIGMDEKDFTLGQNHDTKNLRLLSEEDSDSQIKYNNIESLSKLLNIPKSQLKDPDTFVKAKFAQLYLTKNRYFMFYDVMGSKEYLDSDTDSPKDYRFRLESNWEEQFHSALQDNKGFNLMEALSMAMKAKNLDKSNPSLYQKVLKYSDTLRQKGPKTRLEANMLERQGRLNTVG